MQQYFFQGHQNSLRTIHYENIITAAGACINFWMNDAIEFRRSLMIHKSSASFTFYGELRFMEEAGKVKVYHHNWATAYRERDKDLAL